MKKTHTMAQNSVAEEGGLRKAQQTELEIFRRIHEHPRIARSELAEASGLSTAALTGIVNSLLAKNLVTEDRDSGSGAGRRRMALTLRGDMGYLLGIDLGTFNLRLVLSNACGEILAKRIEPSRIEEGRERVIEHCISSARQLLLVHGIGLDKLLGIGMAFSGVIDVKQGIVLSYPRPGQMQQWRNVPLRAILEEAFGVPCYLEDSVRAIATMEKYQGQGKSLREFVYVDVGMGIGSSIFIHGELYRGFGGGAGEFGHVTIDENGPVCCCGNRGCLEAVASGATIIQLVRSALERGATSRVAELVNGRAEDVNIECIAAAAEQDDSLAMRILADAALHIGSATADLLNLLNPEAVIFGGALFRAAPHIMIEHIARAVRHKAMEKPTRDAQLLVSTLESDAGAVGMAHLAARYVLESVFRQANT